MNGAEASFDVQLSGTVAAQVGTSARSRIQARALRSVVAHVELHVAGKLPLDIQIPDLHVAEPVIRIERVVIRHRASARSPGNPFSSVRKLAVAGSHSLRSSRTAAETQNSE